MHISGDVFASGSGGGVTPGSLGAEQGGGGGGGSSNDGGAGGGAGGLGIIVVRGAISGGTKMSPAPTAG